MRVVNKLAGELELVNHNLDGVVLVAVEFHALCDLHQFAVHTCLNKAFVADLFEQFFVMTFAVLHNRRKYQHTLAGILLKDKTDNLFVGIMNHLFACHI